MTIHYIQHEPFEDLGCIRDWLILRKISFTNTHIWEKITFPSIDSFDMLIIMGGSMSVNDENILPWLKEEKLFIKNAIEANKKVIGICLGAQLIANVLGSKVYQGVEKEIGWFPVSFNKNATNFIFLNHFPNEFLTMHWHGETFNLPENCTLIASSQLTKNQAFIYENHVLALQFHPEMNEKAIQGMIDETGELKKSNFVQSINEIRNGFENCKFNNELIFKMLDSFVSY